MEFVANILKWEIAYKNLDFQISLKKSKVLVTLVPHSLLVAEL